MKLSNHSAASDQAEVWRTRSAAAILSLILAFLLLLVTPSYAQRETGTVSGTVADTQGAVIPNASILLVNVASGDKRETVSNGTGFFTITAVPPGTYTVAITADGFGKWLGTDVIMHSGESHELPNIALNIATATSNIEVVASQAAVIPLDSGESSTTINEELVENLSIQGRDAAELVKFMPGMGMNTGLSQTSFSSQTTATNSGPIGAFSANGTQPYGSMQMTLDGASLVDVGNQGTQIANVNQDTTKEFTYLNASFGADTPRGPTIIQITSKSGGKDFHGDAYIFARNWQANANDAYFRESSTPRPSEHQTYMGGTVGGPVFIPRTSFNANRDKLFFFGGYEKMLQDPFPTLHQLVAPTTDMINGDFGANAMAPFINSSNSWWPTLQTPCANAANWTSYCPVGGTNPLPGGIIPNTLIDPEGKALLTYLNKVNTPNIDPATHNGYNFQYLDNAPVNRWEMRLRGDYNLTPGDKFSVVYTKQNEADTNHFGIWWTPGMAGLSPSPLSATTLASLWTVNYTKVLSATMTNEASFFHTYFTFPPAFNDPTKLDAAAAGYTSYSPFGVSPSNSFDQLPNLLSWGCSLGNSNGCFAGMYVPPMIKGFNNAYGNIKKITALQDNVSKLYGRHSLKAGFFWDENFQTQTTGYGNWTQGAQEYDQWSTFTTNNPYADMLMGHTDGMAQYSTAPVHSMAFYEWAVYAQDQWHVSNKLTLNYGVRFEHDGNWAPTSGTGIAVWNPATYDNTSGASAWTGMQWHQTNSKIPQSGFVSKLINPDPRLGFAYDARGNGKVVVRGGFGIYRWQFSEGDIDAGLNPGLNVQSISTPSTTSIKQLASFSNSPGGSWCALNYTCATGVQALKMGEDKSPYTMNWDLMVDTALPGAFMLELQYIGNKTANALLGGNGSTANFNSNINKIPVGGLYGASTLTGLNTWKTTCATGAINCAVPASGLYGGYVPYANYGTIYNLQHGSYSNYNGMVVALQKQTGRVTFLANYTWSKVLGIRDGQSDNGTGDGAVVDGFNLRNNYGPLSYDHSHIFNTAYYITLPGITQQSRLVKQLTNGWSLSGDFQIQAGAPLQPNTGGNLNTQWNGTSSAFLLGTNGMQLQPYLSCNPKNGGGKYFNPTCFETPTTLGVNGPAVWPYIKGPSYFMADVTTARTFRVTERQKIEFRAAGFNFLNHPNQEFGDTTDDKLNMTCVVGSTGGCPGGGVNTNTTTTGTPVYHRGRRVIEVALKYYF